MCVRARVSLSEGAGCLSVSLHKDVGECRSVFASVVVTVAVSDEVLVRLVVDGVVCPDVLESDVARPAFVMLVVHVWCGPDYTEGALCLSLGTPGSLSVDASVCFEV